jgi:hypothetical protein
MYFCPAPALVPLTGILRLTRLEKDMRRLRFLIISAFAIAGCSDKPSTTGPVPFDTTAYAFDFPVGQTRLLLRTVRTESGSMDQTNQILGWFRIEKDTLFGGNPAQIVTGSFWEAYSDTLFRYRIRELHVREDSGISVYQFKGEDSDPFLVSLLKSGAWDTNTFSDRMTLLRYPLALDRPWPIRSETDPSGSIPLRKEFIGTDTLEFKGRQYACGVLLLHTLADIPMRSWISRIGLLKAEIDFGWETVTDTAGKVDSVRQVETYTLLDVGIDSTAVTEMLGRYGNGPRPPRPMADAKAAVPPRE